MSDISWIRETNFTHKPVFSNGYNALDGRYRVAVSYPMINRETGEYHVRTVMAGKPDFAVYNFKNGKRLNTGFPINLERNQHILFLL